MAVPTLQIPGYSAPTAIDFSPLANLGNVYQKAQQDAARKQTLASLGQGGGGLDYGDAARKLLSIGDTQGAMSLAQLGNNQRDFAFRQQEAQRAQANADRSFGQQERLLGRKDIPSGFQHNPTGGLQPIPGGPADPSYKRQVTDRQNAPAGYKWKDPNDPDAGLVAIPGGPGEKIPAEVAARLGLAKSFLGQLDDYTDAEGKKQKGLRSRIKSGDLSGLIDGIMGASNIGEAGSIRRKISSGSEALLRNLTGAGMSIEEAKKYVARYEPEWNDSADTLLDKVNQLERELRSVNDVVSKGRGGSVLDEPTTPAARSPGQINSKAQFDALPSGSVFIAPDGSKRVKP